MIKAAESGNVTVVKALLKAGASKDIQTLVRNLLTSWLFLYPNFLLFHTNRIKKLHCAGQRKSHIPKL